MSAELLPPKPNLASVVTEDDAPVDNIYSEKQQRLFTSPLYTTWSKKIGNRPFVALANVGLFYSVKIPPIVPDGLLAMDVELPEDLWARENRSFFIWEYGKVPDVVLEVVSNLEGQELDDKKRIYAQIGVLYYIVWDPKNFLGQGTLVAFVLSAKILRSPPGPVVPGSGAWHDPVARVF